MDASRKVKSGKSFYIVLDQLPDYVFKDGDIVSGKCCLLSSLDEDVGSIAISFHGTVKVRFVLPKSTHQTQAGYSQNHQQSSYDSEDILFSDTKSLYKGPYTLRKNVLYEWPFQFQFPSRTLLPPSGTFRKDLWNSATVAYELEACRGRTSQEAASLEKRITPVGKSRDASTQSRTMFERIGSFTGMVAIAVLQVSPPKRRLPERITVPGKVERRFPVKSTQSSGSHHHGLSGLFHHQGPDVGGNIVLDLPPSLIHGSPMPILLRVETSADVAQVFLQSIEIYFTVFKTVISNLGHHRQTDESKITLLGRSKVDLPLAINSTLDIGNTFNVKVGHTIVPSFIHSRVEVHYNLQVYLVIECGGQIFKEDFLAEDVQIMSNRTPNSSLRHDHLGVFFSGNLQSDSAPPLYPGIDGQDGQDGHVISNSYLRLSRLLKYNFIPHSPAPSQTGEPTIKLHSQPQLTDSPSSSQQPSTNPFSMNGREDALRDDQDLLDNILNEENGYKATTMRSGRAALERFAYSWHPPIILSLKARVRGHGNFSNLEISALDEQSSPNSEVPPPPYFKATDPFSPITLLNNCLHLIADFQLSDVSSVLDVEYAINEFRDELRARLGEIDVKTASRAVAKFENLRGPLMELGVEFHLGRAWGEDMDNKNEKRRDYQPDVKGKNID